MFKFWKKRQHKATEVEREFEYEGREFWWKVCEIEKCDFQVCLWASDKYCYKHSKWWRPFIVPINKFRTKYFEPKEVSDANIHKC